MEINPNGHVLKYAGAGGVAEAAGVPVPSRIVSVNRLAVSSKKEIGAALSTVGIAMDGKSFSCPLFVLYGESLMKYTGVLKNDPTAHG
jgi:hypothetical protein